MNKKLLIPLSIAAAATLAACGGQPYRSASSETGAYAYAAPADPQVSGANLVAGRGKVAYVVDPTGPVAGVSTQRIVLHMDNGAMQDIVRRGDQLALGEHVVLRQDNTIRRAPPAWRATE